ncbi:LRRN4 C-terminal-like protein [Hyla sarda]|uniref:LRRN4 C-terminal-like protein n=1 Tax=Hyla sarda TaxID=327740 RepID=UPI0024C40800|nr:LRRN4 C-terminal-like protein [Hyla sarda]XP_056384464.1 LRRN4 C-terminal-like protein [Hyla sarda]XP_056384465.1 LRRN4 C-terminal-like protein [Hyla sarda]
MCLHISLLLFPLFLLFQLCVITTGFPLENDMPSPMDSNDTLPWSREISFPTTVLPHGRNNEASDPQAPDVTRSLKTTQEHILYLTEHVDYDDYENEDDGDEVFTDIPHFSNEACPYDRCKHLQLPCDEIQKRLGGRCLCPGISGSSIIPDSPRLKQVTPGQTQIEVNWCAPLSTVQSYRVLYGTPEGPLEMGPSLNQSYRFFSITNLLSGTAYRVCVVAINEAGQSQVQPGDGQNEGFNQEDIVGPCSTFHTLQGSYVYLAIGFGLAILAGVLGVSILIYWFSSRKKVRSIKRARGDDIGVTNMSFKAESTENL